MRYSRISSCLRLGPPTPPERGGLGAEDVLRALVETSEDAIVAKTAKGVVTAWNESAERLFGYTAAEAIGRHITLIIPEDRRPEEDTIMARLLAGEKVRRFETVRRARDGRLLEVELSIAPIRNERNEVIGATKIARDLTPRRQAEAALREEERRFRTLADNISQLAWMADSGGRIFWYNRAVVRFHGHDARGHAGVGVASRAPSRPRRARRHRHAAVAAIPASRGRTPSRFAASDGEYRWFLSRALPIRDATAPSCAGSAPTPTSPSSGAWRASCASSRMNWAARIGARTRFWRPSRTNCATRLGAMRTSVAVLQVAAGRGHDAPRPGDHRAPERARLSPARRPARREPGHARSPRAPARGRGPAARSSATPSR